MGGPIARYTRKNLYKSSKLWIMYRVICDVTLLDLLKYAPKW